MNIRLSTNADYAKIRALYLSAFDCDEGAVVADLAIDLSIQSSMPEVVHLVAEVDGGLVGHVAFSPVWLKSNQAQMGYILAPLAVLPQHQKNGVGSALVRAGLGKLKQLNTGVVFVYGDPKYYNRFGFDVELAQPFVPPCPLQYPTGWQALKLRQVDSTGAIKCVPALSQPELW